MIPAINSAVAWVFVAVGVAAFVVEVWAFAVAVKAPARAYLAAGKQTKARWVALTGGAAFVGLCGLPLVGLGWGFGNILTIAAVVVAGVFLASVRPVVAGYRRRRPPRQQSGGW